MLYAQIAAVRPDVPPNGIAWEVDSGLKGDTRTAQMRKTLRGKLVPPSDEPTTIGLR